MSFHVFLTVDLTFECFLTVRTHVGPDVRVGAEMSLQTAVSCEHSVTQNTFEVLQTRMGLHMSLQYSARHKRTFTLCTTVRFLPYARKISLFYNLNVAHAIERPKTNPDKNEL